MIFFFLCFSMSFLDIFFCLYWTSMKYFWGTIKTIRTNLFSLLDICSSSRKFCTCQFLSVAFKAAFHYKKPVEFANEAKREKRRQKRRKSLSNVLRYGTKRKRTIWRLNWRCNEISLQLHRATKSHQLPHKLANQQQRWLLQPQTVKSLPSPMQIRSQHQKQILRPFTSCKHIHRYWNLLIDFFGWFLSHIMCAISTNYKNHLNEINMTFE